MRFREIIKNKNTKAVIFIVMAIVAGSVWLIRIPLSYFLGVYLGFGAPGIWWSMNISIACQCLLMTRRYFSKRWMQFSEQVI